MVYFPIVFLCICGLFLTLLRDRYRFWTTMIVMAGAYIFSLVLSGFVKKRFDGPVSSWQAPCIAGICLFLLASIFIQSNNLLQKLYVSLLCLTNFAYCLLFIPLFLGAMPFSAAGAMGGFLSVLLMLLVNLVLGLCLYRPLQRFSERGPSLFLGGMLVLTLFLYMLCLGKLDGLFGIETPTRRLLLATGTYCTIIFGFRSVYQAGCWQAQDVSQIVRDRMFEMESGDFMDMLAAVREVRAAQKTGEYALETVSQLLMEERVEEIPDYIDMVKQNTQHTPILTRYHENPYLNAVIASKAAYAAQNDVDFQCNASRVDAPLKTVELCISVNEMLTRACSDAVGFDGPRKVRFTATPAENSLRLEAVYSGKLPEKHKFDPSGKKFSDLLAWLFDDAPEEETELKGLANTAEIVLAHSGSLTVSGTKEEIILRAMIRF